MLPLFLSSIAFAGCDLPSLQQAIEDAETAFSEMEPDQFEGSVFAAAEAMGCMEDTLTPIEAAGYHRLNALSSFFADDSAATKLHFAAVQATQPGYVLSDAIAPEGHPLRENFEAARQFASNDTFALKEPAEGWLNVDGKRTMDAPSGRPFIFQRFEDSGSLAQTAYLAVGRPVPAYPLKEAPAPVVVAPSGGAKTVLKVVGIGMGVASAGLYGTALATRGAYNSAVEEGNREKIDATHAAANALTIASIGSLGAGVGVTVTGFLGGGR